MFRGVMVFRCASRIAHKAIRQQHKTRNYIMSLKRSRSTTSQPFAEQKVRQLTPAELALCEEELQKKMEKARREYREKCEREDNKRLQERKDRFLKKFAQCWGNNGTAVENICVFSDYNRSPETMSGDYAVMITLPSSVACLAWSDDAFERHLAAMTPESVNNPSIDDEVEYETDYDVEDEYVSDNDGQCYWDDESAEHTDWDEESDDDGPAQKRSRYH